MRNAEVIRGLYAIVDPRFLPADRTVADYAALLVDAGCPIIQLRVKGTDAATRTTRMHHAEALATLCTRTPFTFIINDDIECARAINADGVHIGKDDGEIAMVRTHLAAHMLLGYSAHSLNEGIAAAQAGADYVAFGAIFPTQTKGPGHPIQGIAKLHAFVQEVAAPVVAIGGITDANAAHVWRTGVASVAMITGLAYNADPAAMCKQLIAHYHAAQHEQTLDAAPSQTFPTSKSA